MHSVIPIFYYFGKRMGCCKDSLSYWKNGAYLILIWCLVEGTRYGRGPDFFWYKFQYEQSDQIKGGTQFVFFLINKILLWFDSPYPIPFALYALFFIISFLLLNRYWGRASAFMPIFFLCAVIEYHETFVRQMLSIGMVGFCFNCLLKNENKYAVLWAILSFYTHSGSILLLLPVLITYHYFSKKAISPLFAVSLYIIIAFFSNFSWFAGMQDLWSKIHIDIPLFQRYLSRSAVWFSQDAMRTKWTQSLFTFIMRCSFDVCFIILSHKMLKYVNKKHVKSLVTCYNLSVVGCILLRLFWYLEMMRRIIFPLYILWFIPVGYAFFIFKKSPNRLVLFLKFIILLYLFMYQSRFVFLNPDASYIWDQRVRDTYKGTYILRDI